MNQKGVAMSVSIGLDIAKEKIDFYCEGKHAVIPNDHESIKKYFTSIDSSHHQVIMEATGKYHRVAESVLNELGFSTMVVNPYQSKHFANAMNLKCKTDKVDAKMLAEYASRMEFKATRCATQAQRNMQDLSRHLDDLKKFKIELQHRLKESSGFIAQSLEKTLEPVDQEIKATEEELKSLVKADEQLQKRMTLLLSIPGIGESTALSLLSYLKELGTISKREIAALSGLAPMNFDSGKHHGKRRIKGGRHDVRVHLYMPILDAATQHNTKLKRFYTHLVAAGKPKKVALTACMRKLIVWANAILMTGLPWNEKIA
jgi:transposase